MHIVNNMYQCIPCPDAVSRALRISGRRHEEKRNDSGDERRAERRGWELAGQTPVNPQALIFLNRLSDLLFVMARAENQGGAWDLLWEAGKSQGAG